MTTTTSTLSRVMFKADLRDFATLFFTFVFPAVLLVALVLGLGDMPSADGGNSVNEISANVVAFGIAFVAVFAGSQHIAAWHENGMLLVLRSAPVSAGNILVAQALVGGMIAIVQAIFLVVIAVSPWLGMTLSGTAPLALAGVVLGYFMFFSLGVILANVLPSMTAVTMLAMIVVMGLGVFGGAMMPLDYMPDWVQSSAPWTPVFHIREVITFLLTGIGEWSQTGISSLYLIVVGGILYLIARKTMRWG
ncbi:ABC transporter permease [Arthrobacter sp. G119Y2]|uniref:ABC transporter permease n=1 Tax=Arthrobacter sp. G119Y2 TaxID=3134965 RepID=UPI0031197A56